MTRPEPGEVLARRYLLVEPLATGGTAVIWRAFDRALERTVAVKTLSAQAGPQGRERARDEARTAARLVHPDAIEVYDYGEAVTSAGRVVAFVVMRLLEGVPLAERIAAGRLPSAEAAGITARIAAVLAAAHARGIVHRDVTAENVMLTAEGPKLLDFGIAAHVGDPDDGAGTPPYLAPERLEGAAADPAVDVYALGVLLFSMLTGHHPYPETTWEEVAAADRSGPPPRPEGVPAVLAALCRRCLAADPVLRPSAGEVMAELRAMRTRSRWRLRSGALFVAAAVLVGGGLWFHRPDREPAGPVAAVPPGSRTPFEGPPSTEPGQARQDRVPRRVVPSTSMVRQAAARFRAALERERVARDVAVDLTHLLDRATVGPDGDRAALADLRTKLSDRWREGRISPALGEELLSRLDEIALAFGG